MAEPGKTPASSRMTRRIDRLLARLARVDDRDQGWALLQTCARDRSKAVRVAALIRLDEWILTFRAPPPDLVAFIQRTLFDPDYESAKWAVEPARRLGLWPERTTELNDLTRRTIDRLFVEMGEKMRKRERERRTRDNQRRSARRGRDRAQR